jgi:hypothetical protein
MLFRKFLAVIKQQFFTNVDIAESDELDTMFAVDEHNLGFAVQTVFFVVCVINEAGFVAVACGVDDPIAVEVEEKGEEFAVVDNAASLGFGGRDNLVIVNISSF